jgi:glycosyltransferase involved in cell wall biosynthesis
MKIAVIASHIGSSGIKPSGQHGGGELHTFAFLQILNEYYDVVAVTPNGFYPAFDSAKDYGFDLEGINWRPLGDTPDWLRSYDVMIAMDHGRLYPPICTRNILSVFFPQYPDWNTNGYDTIIANSDYTASWVKKYWGRDALTVYPPTNVQALAKDAGVYEKKKRITSVGRFFRVPGGNNKNHIVLIENFKKMMLPDWELCLIGAKQNKSYYEEVLEAIDGDDRIKLLHDLTREDYARTLGESSFIWAATGWPGVDEDGVEKQIAPSSREHFGIFPVEGAVLGAVPIVHNSGGTPEGPVLTWDTPERLRQVTLHLINDPVEWARESDRLSVKAVDFSVEVQTQRLIDVIERPVILGPSPTRGKIFVGAPPRESLVVGMVSDSAEITTGFGNITRTVGNGLSELGYNVKVLGLQDTHYGPPHYQDGLYTWRGWPGLSYSDLVDRFVQDENVDVVYVNYDPGNIRLVLDVMRDNGIMRPVVSYMPIEAAPVIDQMIETIRLTKLFNGETILYTKWAVDKVLEAGGPRCRYVHHGVDHAAFAPPGDGVAQDLRKAMGWTDKFVVVNVGRNKRSKNIIKLLDVAKIIKDGGNKDFVFYIHTNVNEVIPNSSLPLGEAAIRRGIDDIVYFPIDLHTQQYGVPYAEAREIHVEETDDPRRMQEYMLSAMTFIERLWLAQPNGAYCNTSMAEGFGLVPIEAMACGVPIVSVDDRGVQREVMGNAPLYVPGENLEYWHTTGELWNFDSDKMAGALLALRDGRVDRQEMIRDGLAQAEKYRWQNVVNVIDDAILRRVSL